MRIELFFNGIQLKNKVPPNNYGKWNTINVQSGEIGLPQDGIRSIEIRIQKPFNDDNKNKNVFIFIDNIQGNQYSR